MMVVNAVKCFRYSVLSMIKRLMSLLLTVVVSAAASLYAQVEFKRGLEQISFVPKGQWITGVNVSFSQSNQDTHLDNARVVVDSETDYTVENLYQISHNYSAMACFRNYISLGRSHRFGFFNEVQLQFGGGESKIISGTGQDLTGTFERNWNMNIGLAPGMVMFLNNYSAIEVNVGVLGFNYSHSSGTTDQIYDSSRHSKQANFKINLFSITFGVAFYL